MKPYIEVETQQVTAANGITYAYRRTGPQQGLPLVMCQHFRGNLDNWDPALVDALAVRREVITFDNVGVGATSGRTPHTVAQMAQDALEFLAALDITRATVLGYSLGGFVAQELTLTRPDLVDRLVLAATAPKGAPGMHGWARDVMDAIGTPNTAPDGLLRVFFRDSPSSHRRAPSSSSASCCAARTATPPRRGRPELRSTTRSCAGASPTTHSSKGSVR